MRSGARPSGPKPKVAYANHDAAMANIATKRDALNTLVRQAEEWIAEGEPRQIEAAQEIVRGLPVSVRKFNAWSSSQLPDYWLRRLASFRVSANQTLLKSGLLDSVKSAVDIAKELCERPSREVRKHETAARLQRDLKLAVQLRLIAEQEILRLKVELRDSKDREENLLAQLESANRESARLVAGHQTGSRTMDSSNVVTLSPATVGRGKRGKRREP
jgi:hypothetical protein